MSREATWPWSVLDLKGMPETEADVRRAYARRLKQIDQATDIEGFTALREAFQWAQGMMRDRGEAEVAFVAPDPAVSGSAMAVAAVSGDDDSAPAALAEDPESASQRKRDAAFQALIAGLTTPNPRRTVGERICEAMASPFATDEDYAAGLRYHIARLVADNARQDQYGEVDLAESIDAATIDALDKRYGWLSDHAAFRQDFWNNLALLDAMALRAYGHGGQGGPLAQNLRQPLFKQDLATGSWVLILVFIAVARLIADNGLPFSMSDIPPAVFVITALLAVFTPVIIFMIIPYLRARFAEGWPRTSPFWQRVFRKGQK